MKALSVLLLCGMLVCKCYAQQCNSAQSFAYEYLKQFEANGCTLQLAYHQNSPAAEHFTFQQYYNGVKVFGSKLKLNVLHSGALLSVSNLLCATAILRTAAPIDVKNAITNTCYFNTGSTLVPAYTVHNINCGYDSLLLYNLTTHKLLAAWDVAQHYEGDTTIRAKIFLPDPITSANQMYGGTYKDNNDANAPWLSAEQQEVAIPAFYDGASSKFILKNKYAEIVDQISPTIAPASSLADSFFYTRAESGFEDCNALFHITQFHKYFDSLGFSGILPMAVRVDAHGNFGADNSTFYKTGLTPLLDLGEGGVDDAEDADVIIHEYSHGVSWSANGNFIATTERDALDEGLADYFAASYSKRYNTLMWQNVFSWDGHNEFWDGRTVQTTNDYASVKNESIYTQGEVWSTAMMRIWDSIGAEKTDKLMLQALFSFTDTTTFANAAAYVLQADSIYYSSNHHTAICSSFNAMGIVPTWGCNANGNTANTGTLKLYNSNNFAYGTGNATLKPIATGSSIHIVDIYGRVVATFANVQGMFTISTDLPLTAGIYTIVVSTGSKQIKFKFTKLI